MWFLFGSDSLGAEKHGCQGGDEERALPCTATSASGQLLVFRQYSQALVRVSASTPDHYVLESAAIGVPVKSKMPVHRIVARCIPSFNNRSYYHWQTAILTFFLSNDIKIGALNDFSRLLVQRK